MLLPKGLAILSCSIPLISLFSEIYGYDNSRYWGQNSYGATHSDTANWQKTLSYYCQDDTINVIPLAFLNVFFSTGGLPEINMANSCSEQGGVFPGTSLADCRSLALDIKACQARGKIITLSLGGATGASGFTSDAQAQTFADTIWNLFLGGSSSTRPLETLFLMGKYHIFSIIPVDLDIEGGSNTGFAAFVTRIRSHTNGASKSYYVTAAPQSVLNAVGFDAVYVQVSPSSRVNNYNNPNSWNFGTWDTWAKTTSPNKNIKVYIGAPASSTAAGSGYVDAITLGNIAKQTHSQYPSFGGIMLWDASQAYGNGRYDVAVKSALGSGGSGSPGTTSTSRTTTTTATRKLHRLTYQGGNQVTYNGHLWTAKWWSHADVPGGTAGVWTDGGICTLGSGGSVSTTSATSRTTTATATTKPTTTSTSTSIPTPTAPSTGGCSGVAAWASTVAVSTAGVWMDNGVCTAKRATLHGDTAMKLFFRF
ncbi:glycoside hydrolase superfamily [Cyathus striatus]|nr:glycoside hydrolase superfamily [Cyathus striatus]